MIFCIGWLSASSERYNSGTTAARRDGVRVFKQFAWLEVDSVKIELSRPTSG